MFRSWRKVAMIVGAGVALSALVIPGSASAATSKTQLEVCNTAANSQEFSIGGTTENGSWKATDRMTVDGHGCNRVSDWWWMTGSNITIDHQIGTSAVVRSCFAIPAEVQGDWQTATITWNGPPGC